MMRRLAVFSLAVLFMWPVHALDKEKLAVHLRKALNLDKNTEIKVMSEPRPAGFGDLNVVDVTVGGGTYPVYINKDETQYLWGYAFDLRKDPDAERMKAISLKNAHAKGSASAPVTIVEYSDLQCSYCKKAHEVLSTELHKHYSKDDVRLVFKHYPLNSHAWAEPAAVAAECAGSQSEAAFWEMTDQIFDEADKITAENVGAKVREIADGLGLNMQRFKSCQGSDRILKRVRADKNEGNALGVSSTPTLFVNGRMKRGFRDFNDLKALIDEQLEEAKK